MKRALLTLLIVSIMHMLPAQEINYNQPTNSSYLAEYGLSTNIFDVLISPMHQERYAFTASVVNTTTAGGIETKSSFGMVYDPFYEYGKTIKMIITDPEIYETRSKSQLKRDVGKANEVYKKVSDETLVKEEEVGLVSKTGDQVMLGFSIPKNRLPNYLKHLSYMEGRMYINGGLLDRIELNLMRPTKAKGIKASEAQVIAYFKKNERDGGYLLSRTEETVKGEKGDSEYFYSETIEIVAYRDRDGKEIQGFEAELATKDPAPDTLKVKIERSLPLLGNAARKAGYELPLPYGVDLFAHFQREQLGLEKVILNGTDLTNEVLAPGQSSAKAITNLQAARADVWILPFFNVTLITGYISGSTEVKLTLSDEVKNILDILGVNSDNLNVVTEINGPMAGAGFTVAGGYKNLFATVNGMYINQFVQEANLEVQALALTPLIGYRSPNIVNVMIGGQYQVYDSNVSGSITLEDEPIDFSVELKATQWNWLFGLQRDFSNHWNGSILIGTNPRPQTTVTFGYRF